MGSRAARRFRGGGIEDVAAHVLLPLGEHLAPRAEAPPIGEYYLKNFVDGLCLASVPRS